MNKTPYSGHEMRCSVRAKAHGRRGFTLIELLIVVLILGLLLAILGPTIGAAFRQAYRGKCKTNLHELARACNSYAGEGTLHRGGTRYALPNSSPATDNWGSLTEGNSAALWVLVKHGFAGTELFYCPEAGLERDFDEPDKDGIGYPDPVASRTEFTSRTISYSYISMVEQTFATTTVEDNSNLIILGDQNPRCTLGLTGVSGSASFNMAADADANSLNHDGKGQVVARLDASVVWIESPTGTGEDDIYAANGADEAAIAANEAIGRRDTRDDVLLIP
jgi:prepilin-type N-terminal cleavage/methylation domain-containing protein